MTTDRTERGMRVSLDLLNPDGADLLRNVTEEYGYKQFGEDREQFDSQS